MSFITLRFNYFIWHRLDSECRLDDGEMRSDMNNDNFILMYTTLKPATVIDLRKAPC